MSAPPVSILIPYCNYLHDTSNLRECLQSLNRQTLPPHRVLLLDDSHPSERPEVRDICHAYNAAYHAFPFVNYAPAFGRKLNLGVAISVDQMVCLLCSNWVLAPDWLELMATWLASLGPGNIVTGNSDRPDWFQGTTEPVPITSHYLLDSGFLTLLYKQDWLPWDEDFDPPEGDMSQTKGAWHGVTEWNWRMLQSGKQAWTWNKPQATHLHRKESPAWIAQVRWSERIMRAKGVP